MIEADKITAVTALLEQHGIAEFEYEADGVHIRLTQRGIRQDAIIPAAATGIQPPDFIAAPYAGVFLTRHPLEGMAKPLPRRVRRDEIIAYLQAGPILRPLTAPADGVLAAALVEDGTLAGYGTALFRFHPSAQ